MIDRDHPDERFEEEADPDTFYDEWDRFFLAFENFLQVTKVEKETPR